MRHLQDKSSTVRKYVIRVLCKLILTHPYSMYGGELNIDDWKKRLETLNHEINVNTAIIYIQITNTGIVEFDYGTRYATFHYRSSCE